MDAQLSVSRVSVGSVGGMCSIKEQEQVRLACMSIEV